MPLCLAHTNCLLQWEALAWRTACPRRTLRLMLLCFLCYVGILNIFNPCKPEGGYQLDLLRWEERQVTITGLTCKMWYYGGRKSLLPNIQERCGPLQCDVL
jgi:hypothetical protein